MVATPPSRGRPAYGSPDVVLAEAHRIAADIRRRAERDAIAVRREAAEWASATRREAERYRERVLAELEHARAVAEEVEVEPPAPAAADDAARDPGRSPIIDLRPEVDESAVRLVEPRRHHDRPEPSTAGAAAPDDASSARSEARRAVGEVGHRLAPGGTYVVGRALPPPSTSIETKVHDVVRLAVRRTFHRPFP